MILSYTEWTRKIAQSLMLYRLGTICSRITRFSPKCSEKISIYQSLQNVYQLLNILR